MTVVVGSDRASVKPRLVVLAWAVAAVSLAGFIAAWVLAARNRNLLDITADFGPDRFLVAYAVVGAVVASRRPANPIGWFLLGIGLVSACRAAGRGVRAACAGRIGPSRLRGVGSVVRQLVADTAVPRRPGHVPAAVVSQWPAGHGTVVGGGLARRRDGSLHPAGRLVLSRALSSVSGLPSVPNPTGIRGFVARVPGHAVSGSRVVPWGVRACGGGERVRQVPAVSGEERLQLKWFAYAAVLSLALLVALLPLSVDDRERASCCSAW